MSINLIKARYAITPIFNRHDPENDTFPRNQPAPPIPWYTLANANAIDHLIDELNLLHGEINALHRQIATMQAKEQSSSPTNTNA